MGEHKVITTVGAALASPLSQLDGGRRKKNEKDTAGFCPAHERRRPHERPLSFFPEHELSCKTTCRYTGASEPLYVRSYARHAAPYGAPSRPHPASHAIPGLRSRRARTRTTRPPTALDAFSSGSIGNKLTHAHVHVLLYTHAATALTMPGSSGTRTHARLTRPGRATVYLSNNYKS